ncbi:MAG TPA: S8 family serine peptidase [Caulobacteraceae bacterium]|nr:S8 family serine peptidase [Caulobacteraceae bacterium]
MAKLKAMWRKLLPVTAAAAIAGAAAGQVLPPLGAPQLPVGPVVGQAAGTLGAVERTVGETRLVDLRAVRLRALIRANPKTIDVDEAGAPVVRGELVAISPSAQTLEAARSAGFTVARDSTLEGLDLRVVVLTAPEGISTRRALKRLRAADPGGRFEFNHLYSDAGAAGPGEAGAVSNVAEAASARLGLIDSGVDQNHPTFAQARVEQQGFAPGGLTVGPHGTAVASLMVGAGGGVQGAAPGAGLSVADVYGKGPTGGSAEAIARAMAWLAGRRTPVINISLVGPADLTLEAAVKAVIARGYLVVAAVGNDGPAAPPLYPASYPGVIAVTPVDGRGKVLPEAGRATHVDFAAPGAGVRAARPGGGVTAVRGASFAAPIVAARLALLLKTPDPAAAARAVATLAGQARDAGAPGPDRVYGKGVVGADMALAAKR